MTFTYGCSGKEMNPDALRIVSSDEVEMAIAKWRVYVIHFLDAPPGWAKAEWRKDHLSWILGVVLPSLLLPSDIRRIATEAYLAGEEAISDGSSVVPDAHRYGNIKDWEGVAHDYLFCLHHLDRADAYGHRWSFWEANNMYRRGWFCDGQYIRGVAWLAGLTVGSWPQWKWGKTP